MDEKKEENVSFLHEGDILKLLPSLKEKKRYIAFEILSKDKISQNEAYQTMEFDNQKYLGNLGLAKASFLPIIFKNNKGVIKVNNKEVDNMKASLSLIKSINNKDVIVRTLTVSGLLNKARSCL